MSSSDDDTATRPTRPGMSLPGHTSADTVVEGAINRTELERGQAIGRYTVLGVLGRGGMGVIYRAYDPELNRNVALKLLRVRRATPETAERARARMLREAQALARLSHPNVIAVYDAGTFADDVFITMELVEGESLGDWMERQSRTRDEILAVFIAAGHGLAAAHAAGLVHRDFKPSNVIVGHDGRVRVLDFGLAKAAGSDGDEPTPESEDSPQPRYPGALDSPLTQQGHIVGTPKYMAPEQLRGRRVDARSDQFGFCVALYHALTGGVPFQAQNLVELLEVMAAGAIREPAAERKLPAWLRRLLHRGLSYHPRDRYGSMDELLAELGRSRVTRRQLLTYAGGGVLAMAAVVFALLRPSAGAARCPAPESHLTAVWNPSVRERVHAEFVRTRRPHAAQTAARVISIIDDYAARWRQMRHQACVDTRERRARSAQLLDLRVSCLERRADQLAAMVALFGDAPSARLVDRAVTAAGKLAVLEDCEADAVLLSRVRPPEDAGTREMVAGLRKQLDAAQAAHRAGDYVRARALIAQLLPGAIATGYLPLVAEVRLLEGTVLDDVDARAAARTALEQAIRLASRSNHDQVEAQAWLQLLWLVGYRSGKYQDAERLRLAAEAAVARAGDKPRVRAQLLNNIAAVLYARGDYEGAGRHFAQALAIHERQSGRRADLVASILANLGMIRYRRGDYAAAADYHRRALASRRSNLGSEHPLVASSLNNLGIVAERQGNLAAARAHYTEALAIRERLLGKNHPKLAGLINNLGNVFFREGKLDRAAAHLRRALALKETQGRDHQRLTSTLDNLAQVQMKRGEHTAALALLERSLAIATARLPADHPDIAYTLTALGECQRVLGRHAAAVAALERALRLRQATTVPEVDLATTQFELARALWAKRAGRARALELAKAARQQFARAGARGREQLAQVQRWLSGR